MGLMNLILKFFGIFPPKTRPVRKFRCRAFRRERRKQAHKAKDIRLAERLAQVGSVDAAGFLRLMEDDEG